MYSFASSFSTYDIPKITRGVRLPNFYIKPEYKEKFSLPDDCTDYQFLLALCLIGLEKKVKKDHPNYKDYVKRMNYELKTFKELGFCSYVLLTWEIIEYCHENNIATGYSRGSVGGSLVFYLIGTIEIDAIEHGLYFERFLSKTRAKFIEENGIRYYQGDLLLDVDCDISHLDRPRLLEWLDQKYKGRIAKLPNIITFSTKILLRELMRCLLDFSEADATRITSMVPESFGSGKNIEDCLNESPDFLKFAQQYPDIIRCGRRLFELCRHTGVHASALVITYEPIDTIFPLQLTSDKHIAVGYSMDDALNMSIKIDILGLKAAHLVHRACQLAGIKRSSINVNDPQIYKWLSNLKTPHGLFQIEAETNFHVLQRVKPRDLNDLGAVVSLARPGALQFVDPYAEFVKTGEFQSVHPFFDDILKKNAGLALYQEDAIRMAHKIGFSLEEGELLRRAIGKKKKDEIKLWKSKIENKIQERNLDSKIGEKFLKIIEDSAGYSFNRSHGIAYATLSAATAYLKYYHPKEFFLALLEISKEESDTIHEIRIIASEMPKFGIQLLPPNILKSKNEFTLESEGVRFGLSAIKGIGTKHMEKLMNFRVENVHKFDIFHGSVNSGIPLNIMTALILCGAFDTKPDEDRPKLLMEYQLYKLLTDKEQQKTIDLGPNFNFNLREIVKALTSTIKLDNGKPIIKESRLATIRKNFQPYFDIYKENRKYQKFAKWYFERELLGFAYSCSLFDIFKETDAEGLIKIGDIELAEENENFRTVGEITEIMKGKSKAKETPYIKMIISDNSGQQKVMMFDTKKTPNIENCEAINGRPLKEKDIVIVRGRKKQDCIFAEMIGLQEMRVFQKFSQLGSEKPLTESES